MQNEMNDKMLRDKLGAFTAPFDAQGWEQMNAMLDNRKKRRGIFWWWLSGTSVAAVFATVGLFLLAPKADNEHWAGGKVENGKMEKWSAVKEGRTTKNEKRAQGKEFETGAGMREMKSENSYANHASIITTPKHNQPSTVQQKSSSTLKPLFTSFKKPTANNNSQLSKNSFTKSNSISTETPATAQVREDALFASLNAQPASLLSFKAFGVSATDERISDDGSVKLPVKKKKFNYELGVVSGALASFTQQQIHNKANWFAGLQQSFRIGKYVAITNGIHYAKTSFSVHRVTNTDSSFSPFAYTSNIQSVSIPIGVNVYPVSTKRVDWYVGAGIVNNIKIKEDMLFELPSVTKQMDNLQNIPTTSGNIFEQHFSTSNETVNIGNYRMGSARYFANFYARTGVEVKLLSNLLLNTGFNYQLSISNTGKQQARPMFFGGELGLRYRF